MGVPMRSQFCLMILLSILLCLSGCLPAPPQYDSNMLRPYLNRTVSEVRRECTALEVDDLTASDTNDNPGEQHVSVIRYRTSDDPLVFRFDMDGRVHTIEYGTLVLTREQ